MLLAILGALVIGITLGLLGSGGSLITVPVLLYILKRPEKLAIAESLAIVGTVALAGAIPYIMRRQVKGASIIFFGFPGMLGACLGGCGPYFITEGIQLTLFAFLIVVVGLVMFFQPPFFSQINAADQPVWQIVLVGFVVGCLTGFLGVGGGFFIVPSLVIFYSLSMSLAVGTSLVIIAMNSFTGFFQQIYFLSVLELSVDWQIIGVLSLIGVLGSFSAGYFSHYIPQIYVRKSFGVTVFLLGFYVLAKHFI